MQKTEYKSRNYNTYVIIFLIFVFYIQFSTQFSIPLFASEANSASSDISQAGKSWQQKLDDSMTELRQLQEEIKNKKIPLNKELNELEDELIEARSEYQKVTRILEGRSLEQVNLRSEIQSLKDEKSYLLNSLLDPYVRSFETRLHIAETRRYSKSVENARLAVGNDNLSDIEVYQAQAALVSDSLDRLLEALGGTRFEGSAIDSSGMVKQGLFLITGPVALFRSQDGKAVGTVEQRLGSVEPTLVGFESQELTKAAEGLIQSGTGYLPIDPSLGNAHKIEAMTETLSEHIKRGGPVMYPILILAAAALIVAIYKWVDLMRIRKPSEKRISELLVAVAEHDDKKAAAEAAAVGGPTGAMLSIGVEHIKEPSALIEEVMYEKILIAKIKLQSLLPFIAISAAASPLLGLLGTVTGIINTFKLITIFGSGDVKMLSGGISEALITTEYGLIVAIPSLLLHAFLSRKARGMVSRMEKAAIAFINQISKTPYKKDDISELLEKIPSQVADEVLRIISGNNLSENNFQEYSEDSAGSVMDSTVVSIDSASTVADAINRIRNSEIDENLTVVFVVDEHGKYMGDVYINKLLTRPEQTRISSVVDTNTLFVRIDTSKEKVRDLFSKYNLNMMPVLNYDNQLVGRITADSVNGNGLIKRSLER
ncbi:MAG: MotA/TolQ/ExbB proton channel family protein [Sedimentisphaerales bacterium]|nr:MotA/TolQ/ExbB proton channel family protein [Sedimentisphaerales bacterium]